MNATAATAPTLGSRIAAFAAAVRAELADLPADDVDDLTDGLDADLAEQASESDEFELPDPVTYAAELRSAAGLPEKTTDAAPRRPSLSERLAVLDARIERAVHSSKAATWVVELLTSLRPVWWIARGWALYLLVAIPFGSWDTIVGFPGRNTGAWLLLGAAVLLSIQWGRGRWAPGRGLRAVRIAASVVAAVTLVFAIPATIVSAQNAVGAAYYSWTTVDESTPGLAVDGTRVRNIFAYDTEGNPIEGVQLFDQDGRPLNTVGRAADERLQWDEYFFGGGGPAPVPVVVPGRPPVWNVYPLREVGPDVGYDENGTLDADQAFTPGFPFANVTAVPQASVPAPTPTPTPAPGAGQGVATDPTTPPEPTATPEPTQPPETGANG